MSKKTRKKARPLFHPALWPSWVVMFLLYSLSWLPMPAKQRLGKWLGVFLSKVMSYRFRVTKTNIGMCMPELSEAQREELARDSFVACARGFLESTHAWWRDTGKYQSQVKVSGRQHLDEAMARGKGILLLGGHYSIFDFALPLIACQLTRPGYMYRPNDNPVIDRMIERGRKRDMNIEPFTKRQLGGMMSFLREGGQVWYACDQDFGRKATIFTPFFGVEAACITTPSYIAQTSGCSVICVSHLRTSAGEYEITFSPIQENFGEDDQKDAAVWNGFIEQAIRRHPDQYLWLHKRFKTRPEGMARLY
jgi:KDO2-lipid IV(A) lauroyltransferase